MYEAITNQPRNPATATCSARSCSSSSICAGRNCAAGEYGNPTTMRFSRRLGEAAKGADYASAIERSGHFSPAGSTGVFAFVVILATVAAFAIAVMRID